jgi:transposase-like protein
VRLWVGRLEQIAINVEAKLGLWWLLTKIKADGGLCLAAIDVDTRECWQHSFMAGNILNAEAFLVLEACTNRPVILVNRDPWYPEALKALLEWIHKTFGELY